MESKEDLLKLLETAPEGQGVVNHENNVITFILKYNIIEGDNSVPESSLYRLYKASTKHYVNKNEFRKLVSSILVRHQSGSSHYYKVSLTSMRVSDEIIKLINEKKVDKTKSLQYIRTFERFLSKFNIERGNSWIEGFVLYELFAKPFRASGRKVPIGTSNFNQFCRLYFDEKRIGSSRASWFGVGNTNIEVENVERIRKRRKNRDKKKRRSKKNSRKSKSCIEEKPREVQSIETGNESEE